LIRKPTVENPSFCHPNNSINGHCSKQWSEVGRKGARSFDNSLSWLGLRYFLPAPFIEARDQSRLNTSAVVDHMMFLSDSPADFRTVIMAGDNLRYYMKRSEFEKIPYPDRPALIKEMAIPWCNEASLVFLPRVYFYDIKTGEQLDSYSCAWGRVRGDFRRTSK